MRDHHELRGLDARLGRLRVGAHQASRSQQDAAEIARGHDGDVGQARMLDGFEGGKPRGFLGFAVVGVAHAAVGPRAAFAQDVGVDVVARHAIGRPHLFEEGEGLLFGFDVGDACDEAALLLFDFGRRAAFYGGVGIHAAYYSTRIARRPSRVGRVTIVCRQRRIRRIRCTRAA